MPKPKSDILTPDALPELLSRGISGVFVFFGDEDYLKTVWLERIAKTVMSAEGFELFNRFSVSFSDEKKGLSQLADALFASPMMQDKTLVEVHDLSLSLAKPSTLDLLCSSLSVASEDTVAIVIFRADELEADYRFSQSPIYKKLSAVSTLVKFDALPDGKLEAWAKKLLSAKKLFLRDDAAKLLVGMCSGKMMNIFGETEKLAAYKKYSLGGSIEITAEDVGEVCCQSAKDEAPFAMSDAASKWNLREMTSALSHVPRFTGGTRCRRRKARKNLCRYAENKNRAGFRANRNLRGKIARNERIPGKTARAIRFRRAGRRH